MKIKALKKLLILVKCMLGSVFTSHSLTSAQCKISLRPIKYNYIHKLAVYIECYGLHNTFCVCEMVRTEQNRCMVTKCKRHLRDLGRTQGAEREAANCPGAAWDSHAEREKRVCLTRVLLCGMRRERASRAISWEFALPQRRLEIWRTSRERTTSQRMSRL